MNIVEIQKQCMNDSEDWFDAEQVHSLVYQALCMAGELGEFCNLLKKIERGSLELNTDTHLELALELTDVFIYMCMAAQILGIDLEKTYEHKRKFNIERFGPVREDSSAL